MVAYLLPCKEQGGGVLAQAVLMFFDVTIVGCKTDHA
jgi:hypothetical protein